jgi:hypothetical protein
MTSMRFLVTETDNYYAQLLTKVRSAKHRVLIAAMAVRSSPLTAPILAEAAQAARRGVNVRIIADPYGLTPFARDTYTSASAFKVLVRQTREQLDAIRLNGGTIHWIGHIGINPFKGRYHPKITVVDNTTYSFGGINFDGTHAIDYMLHAQDTTLAEQLWQLSGDNTHGLPAQDVSLRLNLSNMLLFDAGIPGKSIIYERACSLTKDARKVYFISPLCPSGRLAELLKSTQSICYFNRPSQESGFTRLALAWDAWRTGVPNQYEGTADFHAKCMLFEMSDGAKVVLSGSNNFSWRGVAFGTKEIALQSTDPQLWKSLHDIVFKVATAD